MKSRMKVLYPFIGDTVGGSHVSAILLIRHLERNVVQPQVLLHQEGLLAERLRQDDIPFKCARLPFFSSTGGRLRALLHLLGGLTATVRFLRTNCIDLVHTNDARSLVTWALPSVIAGVRLVHHQRTRFSVSRIPNAAIRLAHAVITISSYNHSSLPVSLRRKAITVPDPYETDGPLPVRADARRRLLDRLGLPVGTRLIGFVGTLQEQKRPRIFLEAAAKISAVTDEPVHFVMFGRAEPSARRTNEAYAATLGIGSRLSIAGYVPDVEDAVAGLDILLAPAVNEGFGRAVVESMLAGTPVLAADSGGHREALGRFGDESLVAADDASALAERGLALLASPQEAARLGTDMQRDARSRFSAATHAKAVAEIYAGLAG